MLGNRSVGGALANSPWKFSFCGGKPGGEASAGSVVLVHGLFLFGFCFKPLAWRLAKEGYDVYVYDYQTRRYGIREHGAHFLQALDEIAGKAKPAPGSLHIVTHSLGGILARVALSSLEGAADGSLLHLKPSSIGRTVMMAPPNKGSDTAKRIVKALPWAGRFAKPLPELSSAPEAEIHSIPIPKSFEIGIIAGNCDMEVALPYTELKGAKARKVLLCDHTFMPYYSHVYKELSSFLKTGSFA